VDPRPGGRRSRNPRFTGDAAASNQAIADAVRSVAAAKGVAPAQVALAWVYAQQERLGVPIAPIPGTKRVKWLEQNVAALDVTLTPDELAVLDPLAAQVTGARYQGPDLPAVADMPMPAGPFDAVIRRHGGKASSAFAGLSGLGAKMVVWSHGDGVIP
jgi:hypothetical protein